MSNPNVVNGPKWGPGARQRVECVGELTMRPAASKAMPEFHQDVFTDSEMRKVIAHLQSLGQQPRKGGRT
jgi:hypothetical protein